MGEVNGLDGADGLNGHCGFLGIAGGFGLGGLVVEGAGGVVLVSYSFAVGDGGEAGGVAVIVGLDGDGRCFTNGVVEGEGNGFNHCVVDGFTVGLLRHGLAASATRCRQGKRHYEGSR